MEYNLGYALAVRRAILGIGRREAATASGLSYPFWCELESGTKNPSWDSLVAITKGLRFQTMSQMVLFVERCAAERAALLQD